MGGSPRPTPMAGKAMNQEFFANFAQRRQQNNLMRQQQNDEMFATLVKSGQRPYESYRSPFEPEIPNYNDFFG